MPKEKVDPGKAPDRVHDGEPAVEVTAGVEDDDEAGSSGTDTTESEESAELADSVVAEANLGKAEGYPEMPAEGIIKGNSRGTIHKAISEDIPMTACGFGLKYAVSGWTLEWPDSPMPLCTRPACFPRRGPTV